MLDPEHITKILAIHFDPDHGTAYWLDKENELGINVRQQIRTHKDFYLLGHMDIEQLRKRKLTDFIPRSLHHKFQDMILSETGGTTGPPCRRVFTPDEFHGAFIRPWLHAVNQRNFPYQGRWLFVGPGGPHIIAQAARKMARATGSLEPFSVDCDVRWFRRQEKGSMGFTLYMDHVLSQAINIINCQDITVLFTTPVLLTALADQMTVNQRERIKGIHTGGMAQTAELTATLTTMYPNAVILPGYGNSLFGVTFECEATPAGQDSVFTMEDPSLWLQLTPITDTNKIDLKAVVPAEKTGRVILHRLDPSFLLLNLIERDCGEYVPGSGCRAITGVRSIETTVTQKDGSVY